MIVNLRFNFIFPNNLIMSFKGTLSFRSGTLMFLILVAAFTALGIREVERREGLRM